MGLFGVNVEFILLRFDKKLMLELVKEEEENGEGDGDELG